MRDQVMVRGQRWVSDTEPELGLGIVLNGGGGKVDIMFPAVHETRCYALESAPLRRAEFLPGDRISTHDGCEHIVDAVRTDGGLRIYETSAGDIAEAELSDTISFSKPEQRLFGGKLDLPEEFDLRGEALRRRAVMRRSPVRGMAGARMDLIPHQLFIADEVASRLQPRVLLADEVGLGKTIEACLIVQRLLLTGRAARVLILVPEPLIHQWFVELLRRFQLSFDLFDEERCAAIEAGDPDCNPFLDSQWVLAAVDFLAADEHRAEQARAAGWDLLAVDEAHHLEWSPELAGPAYEMVRGLAEQAEGLLLLTATPQQLGPEGHFARLRLLDPQRYADLASYREETRHYEEVAEVVEMLGAGNDAGKSLDRLIAGRERLEASVRAMRGGEVDARERLIGELMDGFGVGRVMFRNSRSKLGGFPERVPQFIKLRGKNAVAAKTAWLCKLLTELGEDEKVLVIAKTKELAAEILEQVRDVSGAIGAVFHEDLTLIQRDRNAAYFAEKDGARFLVCSEIGSEGRNFQFAKHLVLFDLPDSVDLLEQRIGRLDRIGQRGPIHIHVPYMPGAEEARMRWFDEGFDAFRQCPPGAAEIASAVAAERKAAFKTGAKAAVATLLERTQACREEITGRLARGQDRLLERTSHQPARAAWLAERIREWDHDAGFEDFVIRLLEYSGLQIEELGDRRYFLLPGNVKSDAFPALPDEGITATLCRQRALEHEHEAFLTWDHPMVRGALDLMLGSEAGNACFGVWETPGGKQMFLEAWVIVECVAPAEWHADRFLPPTPLRLVVDHTGKEYTDDAAFAAATLRRGDAGGLLRNENIKRKVLPKLLETVRELGEIASRRIVADALQTMRNEFRAEISRLRSLAEVNDHIRSEEITGLTERERAMAAAIQNARIRLDAVRLVWKTPPGPK